MKWQARSYVEVQIGVMHLVNSPQQGNRVKHPVLQIDRQIGDDHGNPKRDRAWRLDPIEQSASALFGGERGADRGDGTTILTRQS